MSDTCRYVGTPEPAICGSGMRAASYIKGRTDDNFIYTGIGAEKCMSMRICFAMCWKRVQAYWNIRFGKPSMERISP